MLCASPFTSGSNGYCPVVYWWACVDHWDGGDSQVSLFHKDVFSLLLIVNNLWAWDSGSPSSVLTTLITVPSRSQWSHWSAHCWLSGSITPSAFTSWQASERRAFLAQGTTCTLFLLQGQDQLSVSEVQTSRLGDSKVYMLLVHFICIWSLLGVCRFLCSRWFKSITAVFLVLRLSLIWPMRTPSSWLLSLFFFFFLTWLR